MAAAWLVPWLIRVLQIGVGVDLLLDLAVHHQLLGELVGIHRAGGILVLQLGGEQGQEGREIARQLRSSHPANWCVRGAWWLLGVVAAGDGHGS